MTRANESGNDLGDIDSGLPADDGAQEVRRLRQAEKSMRFFERYGSPYLQPVTTAKGLQPYQSQLLKGLRTSGNASMTCRLDSRPHVTNYPIQAKAMVSVNFEERELRIVTTLATQVSAAKRIDRTLRYGSKARKVDAKRALALNLSATSTLKLLKFMRQSYDSRPYIVMEY